MHATRRHKGDPKNQSAFLVAKSSTFGSVPKRGIGICDGHMTNVVMKQKLDSHCFGRACWFRLVLGLFHQICFLCVSLRGLMLVLGFGNACIERWDDFFFFLEYGRCRTVARSLHEHKQ